MDWAKRLKIRHLDILIQLSETGSLSETARLSHSTQPGLSKWLRELEEDVGALLFERHARGLKPTAMGLSLIEHARRMLIEVSRTQHELDAIAEGSHRVIAVGASPASAPSYVPEAIQRFLQKHPRTRIEIFENTMDALLTRLHRGQLDVVIGRLDNFEPNAALRNEMLYDEPLQIVARVDHPLCQKPNLVWEDLCDYEWIVWPRGTPIRSKLDNAIMQAGSKPPMYRIESSSQMGNLWLLQHSDMLSVGSARIIGSFAAMGLVTPLDIHIDGAQGPVGMVWRDEISHDNTVEDLLSCFRELA